MSPQRAGARGDYHRAATLATAADAPPPGEVAGDELTAAEFAAAVDGWFKPPRLTLGAIYAERQGKWIVLSFTFRKAPWAGYRVKISTAWARVLRGRLSQALDA